MIKKLILVGLLAGFSLLTGCASMPSPEAMKAATASYQLPKLPEPNKAIVYVVRPSPLGGLIRFNVFVDDQEAQSEMGYTKSSQYIYFNVSLVSTRFTQKLRIGLKLMSLQMQTTSSSSNKSLRWVSLWRGITCSNLKTIKASIM